MGQVVSRKRRSKSIEERLWARVEKTEHCWLWRGCVDTGYGITWFNGKKARVHRVAYELLVGPIPNGKVLDHLCRVRNCVNPSHLEAVSEKENILRGVSFSAANAKKAACKCGHWFTPENTLITKNGRECRACHNLRSIVRRRRLAEMRKEKTP